MVLRWKQQFDLHTLVINAENGPESNGHRTQWLTRLVELSDARQLTIHLAYYLPYHSKYNPVERLWGVLENYWWGEITDSADKARGLARSLTYRRLKPTVRKVARTYGKGISVAKNSTASDFSYRGVDLTHMAIKNPIILRRRLVRNQSTNTFQQSGISVAALQWCGFSWLLPIELGKGGWKMFRRTA